MLSDFPCLCLEAPLNELQPPAELAFCDILITNEMLFMNDGSLNLNRLPFELIDALGVGLHAICSHVGLIG